LRAVARGPVTVTVTVALRSVALRALALASASALELDCWILRGPLCERFCALLFWLAGLR
jgi:hypothetical protein